MIGQLVGNYRLLSQLGAGGMGTIYLAEQQLLGNRVAIKMLLPEMSQQRHIVERFFDEARAATRIQDPGIVKVHDFGWHHGSAYIVMEYLAGETLAQRLRRVDRLAVVPALRMLQQCALAMAAAHAQGIVHRDLKPDNIFLVADRMVVGGERVKILDFGIAKLIDDPDASHSRTRTGVIMGTPPFMSPEQCRGAGGVDHRTDIYALGCVLFNMLCGRPPFIAGASGDLLVAHMRDAPPLPSSLVALPPEIDQLVLTCLAKDPAQRFSSMTELVRAAAQLCGDDTFVDTVPPKLATDPTAPTVATTLHSSAGQAASAAVTQTRPWRGVSIIAGTVLVAGVVVAIAMLSRTTAPPPQPQTAPIRAAPTIDAPALSSDAAPPIDAPPLDAPAVQPPAHRPPKRHVIAPPAGSGSAKVDPYEIR